MANNLKIPTDSFNNFFVFIGSSLSKKARRIPEKTLQMYFIKLFYIISFPTDRWAQFWQCATINTTTSAGHDDISTKLLKYLAPALREPLAFIINRMMTSSNRNIFRVAGPLWGNSPVTGEFPAPKASNGELWCFLWFAPRINGWVNNHEAGDLGRHRAHYDVTVIDLCWLEYYLTS